MKVVLSILLRSLFTHADDVPPICAYRPYDVRMEVTNRAAAVRMPVPLGAAIPFALARNPAETTGYIMPHDISDCDYIMRRDIFRREVLSRGRGGVGVANEQSDVEIPNVPKDSPEDYASRGNKTYHIIASYSNNTVYYLLKGALL